MKRTFMKSLLKHKYLLAALTLSIVFSAAVFTVWSQGYIFYKAGHNEIVNFNDYLFEGFKIPENFLDLVTLNHINLTLWLLFPAYFIYNSYETLLLIQSSLVGSSIFTFYLLSKEYLSRSESLMLSIAYSISPAVLGVAFTAFDPVFLSLPVLFLLFYSVKKDNYPLFFVSSIFLLLTKEILALVIFFYGICLLIWREKKKWWSYSLGVSSLFLIIYFYLLSKFSILNDSLKNNIGLDVTKTGLVPSLAGQLVAHFRYINLIHIVNYLSNFLYLPFFSLGGVLLIFPKVVLSLSEFSNSYIADEKILFLPLLFFATLLGIKNLKKVLNRFFRGLPVIKVVLAVFILFNMFYVTTEIPKEMYSDNYYPRIRCVRCSHTNQKSQDIITILKDLKGSIPSQSKIIVSQNLKIFFESNYRVQDEFSLQVEYVIYDRCVESIMRNRTEVPDNYESNIGPCLLRYTILPSRDISKEFREIKNVSNFVILSRIR